ncbi:hypothetical protein CH252_19090 [Rhodococcus sp. 06-1477-1B]|nr:hypothetical protein CH252_19090 [Rhodococcus sp. 06-1477-1B]
MSVSIIPTEDHGSFRVTDRMLYETGAIAWDAFAILLNEEARLRKLDLEFWREEPSRDVIVKWRPHRPPTE